MKNLILTLLFALFIITGFTQDRPYGPVPCKTLEQTIGEDFILVKIVKNDISKANLDMKYADGKQLVISDTAKTFKLISVDLKKRIAHFKDAAGIEYVNDIIDDKRIPDLVLKSDLETAQSKFLNKTLWLNVANIYMGRGIDTGGDGKEITGIRFLPVKIIDVLPGYLAQTSILFIIKTPTGEIGYQDFSISGTNSKLDPKYAFGTFFLTEDPKLKYHFTPAVWKMVQAGYTEIGMPIDAFVLVMGYPDRINNTQTAKGTTQQYVYGSSYYYFAGGKLTMKQN